MDVIDIAAPIVKEFEGCALVAYQDLGGVWTIGYGCTHNVSSGMTITQPQAEERLEQDLHDSFNRIKLYVKIPLKNNQWAALVSLCYNEGIGHIYDSTLLTDLNAGFLDKAADDFLMWDKCRGAIVPGLLRRRQSEKALFVS